MSFLRLFLPSCLLFSCVVNTPSANGLHCNDVRVLTRTFVKRHFAFEKFTDELSTRMVENMVKSLDPSKLYFIDADLKKIRKNYARKMDNLIGSSKCEGIDFIYGTYTKRFKEAQKFVDEWLKVKHDFNLDEKVELDPDKLKFASSKSELKQRWRKRVKFQLLQKLESLVEVEVTKLKKKKNARKQAMKTAEIKAIESVKKRYELARKRHADFDYNKVLGLALNAFALGMDPHSTYFTPEQLEGFRINTRLSLEGIGALLRSEDGFTIVSSLVTGGAAQKGGQLTAGDKIIGVAQGNGTPVDVIDMDLEDVVKMIRGKRGTTVKLSVLREKAGKTKRMNIPIVREKVKLVDREARSKLFTLQDGKTKTKVGVISLPSFYLDFQGRQKNLKDYKSSTKDVMRELKKLESKGMNSLIVDLRSNGGGSLDESISLAGLFVDKGVIVMRKGKYATPDKHRDPIPGEVYSGPLTVLINRQSASASEIFAGAIQDHKRGLIVGDKHTFGKGTVQNLNDLDPSLGAIKVTTSKFYLPAGSSTQKKGVPSDIVLPDLLDELEMGEKYYDYVLSWQAIKSAKLKSIKDRVAKVVPVLKKRTMERTAKDPEFIEINKAIAEYRKNEKTRTLVSLKLGANKKDDDEKEDDKNQPDTDPSDISLKGDAHLQESLRIAADYHRLEGGKGDKLGSYKILGFVPKVKKTKKTVASTKKGLKTTKQKKKK